MSGRDHGSLKGPLSVWMWEIVELQDYGEYCNLK